MKIALVGNGRMGKNVIKNAVNHKIVGVISRSAIGSFDLLPEKPDVIIDFSHPDNIPMICGYAEKNKVPAVIGTTGLAGGHYEMLYDLSETVPIVVSSNFSIGIILICKIIEDISPLLKNGFDIELVETHHRNKLDAPSGTAKMLADIINKSGEYHIVNGRYGAAKREKNDIGIHSVRGGSAYCTHEIEYFGDDETIKIVHEATSADIFARGAILCAEKLLDKPAGMYGTKELLF